MNQGRQQPQEPDTAPPGHRNIDSSARQRRPQLATSNYPWHFWIDRGGTFTDIVARSPQGVLHSSKLLSEDPRHYRDAVLEGIRRLLALPPRAALPVERIAALHLGTTVATNALLERRGEDTLLLVSEGFGDALYIGYQERAHLFALDVRRAPPLYKRVGEVRGRIDATGRVLRRLDSAAVRRELAAAYRAGLRSCAVVLMHACRNPRHEERVAQLAREAGFTQVTAGHRVAPVHKWVVRGNTAVVDAYLSPVLHRYTDRLAQSLGDAFLDAHRLRFMQSNGGLTAARSLRACDALLSGPAGGVVGMIKTGRARGLRRMIGFDMGGTSTDVSHYRGEYERVTESSVAGVRLHAPSLLIHSVAAGGGSLLHFDGRRYRVGPESAGADPGPACYGKGGPLTVTDCNLLLGRIQPQYFPRVFGPGADQPPDVAVVRRLFARLARDISARTGQRHDSRMVAEGFLRVAVENMANAIKYISVQRGHDLGPYTLCCYGGAAGQHACQVADALGMREIYLHPQAGVLSALGIGLAEARVVCEQPWEAVLAKQSQDELQAAFARLHRSARRQLKRQGHSGRLRILRRIYLRYGGTDDALAVPFATAEEMRHTFEQRHRERYGFIFHDTREVIATALELEAVAAGEDAPLQHFAPPSATLPSATSLSATPPSATPPSATPPPATPLSATPPSATSPSATPPSATPPSATPPSATPPSATPPSATSPSTPPPSATSSSAASPSATSPSAPPPSATSSSAASSSATSPSVPPSSATSPSATSPSAPPSSATLPPAARCRMTVQGNVRSVPLYQRQELPAGCALPGPALIIDAHSTVVVDIGWTAHCSEHGELLLRRPAVSTAHRSRPAATRRDAVQLEIFHNLFMSVAKQMGAVLENASVSVNIKERRDFSCALFDRHGRLVANAPHIPVHLGSLGDSVRHVMRRRGSQMRPGDLYAHNVPYEGGTHLPDITVIKPVYRGAAKTPLCYVAARGHHGDVGGISPGSMPPHSRSILEEGVLIESFSLLREGQPNFRQLRALLEAGPWPARNVEDNLRDIQAQIAACECGAREFSALVEQFGSAPVKAYMQHIQDNAAEEVRALLQTLPDGACQCQLDDGTPLALALRVDRRRQRACIDFHGTGGASDSNRNAPPSVVRAAVLYVFRTLIGGSMPLNDGCLEPLDIIIPADSLLRPVYPMAVAGGNVETSQLVVDLLFGALGVMAASQGTMNNLSFGNARYQYYETICGGAGATAHFPGADAIHTHMTNSRLTDPEVLERRFPVLLESFALRPNSGGSGQHRGGDGVVRRLRFLQRMEVGLLAERRHQAPFGLSGGLPGQPGAQYLIRRNGHRTPLHSRTRVEAGDILVVETPGGGGCGRVVASGE